MRRTRRRYAGERLSASVGDAASVKTSQLNLAPVAGNFSGLARARGT
jgi:hypothetical protein